MIMEENCDKEYGPIGGLNDFTKATAELAFGKDMNGLVSIMSIIVVKSLSTRKFLQAATGCLRSKLVASFYQVVTTC